MSESELQLAKVQRSFRRSLKTYDENAFVQLEIAQTLMKMLHGSLTQNEQVRYFERVFEIGTGTGFLTKALLENFDINHLVLNDLVAECKPIIAELLSENTLSSLGEKNKSEKLSQLSWEFIEGDINECELTEKQNLICSSSTLQWVKDMPALLEKLHVNLSDGGCLAVSSFGQNHFSELRKIRELNQQADRDKPILNYINEQGWRTLLATKFSVQDIQTHTITLWFDSFDELLKHLRNTGVNGNASEQWSQRKKQEFAKAYESLFAEQGKLPLSYEPIYIIANKI